MLTVLSVCLIYYIATISNDWSLFLTPFYSWLIAIIVGTFTVVAMVQDIAIAIKLLKGGDKIG